MRYSSTVLALALAITTPSLARADAGAGEVPLSENSVLRALDAKPLAELGDNAFRFTSGPALGGFATAVEIRSHGDYYQVDVTFLYGHPSEGWKKNGMLRFAISRDEFTWFLGEVERAERQDSTADDGSDKDGAIFVCTDGPGYLSEIRTKRRTRWISGFCGDNANNAIASLVAHLVDSGTNRYLRGLGQTRVPLRPESD